MRRLLVLAAVTAIAVARPETYREKEDFQYARSSSDTGSKSGYYGAQRGNMGGNYERAHNMDALAQHQMSGLVRQTQGELGDGATERSGTVFAAANSRGMYGSGHYDLSNLEGRNFQEGVSLADSQSHSSLSSQSAGYRGQSQSSYSHGGYADSNAYNSRYRGGNSDQLLYANVQQHNADDLQVANQESKHEAGYYSRSGYNSQSGYSQANLNSADRYGANAQHSHRLVGVSAIPVRVVLRPGTRIAVPVAAETYDASHGSSTFDHNAINTEAESLSGNDQHVSYQPTSNGKHYESSYSYRKEWEKHNRLPGSVPVVIPTINPYPQNSELYEDAQAHNTEQQEARGSESHNSHSSHRSYVKTAASQHQADYNTQHHSSASNADSSAYTLQHNNGAALSQVLNNQVEDLSSKPKSYQSSYSYHKSWERQGDPYVIKPLSTSSDASQRLTAASSNLGAYSDTHQYGSHYRYGSQRKTYLNNGVEDCDCDENGHVRVARSYNSFPDQQQEDLTQQTQHQSDRLEDLGQQTQNSWDNYEDLGQHTQNLDLTQQSQNRWEKLEDLGQKTQNQWGNQQATVSHSNWNTLELEPQSQNTEQQTQNKWNTFETMRNEHNKHNDEKSTGNENTNPSNTFNVGFNSGTENTNSNNNFELQKEHNDANIGHHFQTVWDESQKQDKNTQDVGQQTQDQWNMFHSTFNNNDDKFKHNWHHSINSAQSSFSNNKPYFNYGQSNDAWMNNQEQFFNNNYNNEHNYHWQTHSVSTPEQSWTIHTNLDTNDKIHTSDTSLSSLWDKLDNIEKQSVASQGADKSNDFSTYQQTDQTQTSSDFEHTNQHHIYHNTYDKDEKHKLNTSLVNTEAPTTVTSKTTEKVKIFDILNNHEILRPQDIGRGDIGPEDSITTTEETFYVKPLQPTPKPYKTPEELEILSLSKTSDKTTTSTQKTTTSKQTNKFRPYHQNDYEELGVLNLDETRQTEAHNFESSENKFFKPTTTTTPKGLFKQNTREQDTEQQYEDLGQHHGSAESLGQELVDFGQHENVDFGQQENGGVNFEQKSQNADAQHEHQSNYFNRHNNGFHQESLNNNKPEAFNNQPNEQLEQELVPLQIEDLSQHNKREHDQKHETENHNNNFDKVESSKQENLEQQTQNFEQQTGHFEQENLEQQPQNIEQQIGNFEQENLEQQTQNFEQQTGHFEQENLEQQPQNFEQQTGNFEQENLQQKPQNFEQQIGNFEQENLEQQPQNFEQQTGNFEQENLEQQPQNFEQQTGSFEQENLEQKPQNFEQQTGNFAHEDLQQQHQNFEQENLKQQTQNFEQQTGNFEQENFEQQTQNFEQQTGNFEHENLEQQNQPAWIDESKQQSEHLQKPEMDKFHHHRIPERIEQSNIEIEPPMVSKKVSDIETPPEPVTEKVGFWKSIGSKLGNAKDKVASWFKSS